MNVVQYFLAHKTLVIHLCMGINLSRKYFHVNIIHSNYKFRVPRKQVQGMVSRSSSSE